MSERKQLVVLGGGPGGYPAAFLAADHGMDVTLINTEDHPGGVCLYRGCIPSKALLHVAKLIHESQASKDWGITFTKPKIDLKKLRAFKNGVIGKMTGGLGQLTRARKVNYVQGYGTFKDSHTITVEKTDGKTEEIAFESCIIAAGSHPTKVPGLSIDSPRVMDSTSALELSDIPGKLLVIGGGYIGLEMGSVYAALGSKVTVVEMMPQLLPGADKDMVVHLARRLSEYLAEIKLRTKVAALKENKDGIMITFENPDGKTNRQKFDKVLICVGRRPNSQRIGIEKHRRQNNRTRLYRSGSAAAHGRESYLRHRGHCGRSHARAQGHGGGQRGGGSTSGQKKLFLNRRRFRAWFSPIPNSPGPALPRMKRRSRASSTR